MVNPKEIKVQFPHFKQLKFISMVFSHVCLLDSVSMWKCSAHKHRGSSFRLLTCFVTVIVYIVVMLYFLKKSIKKNLSPSSFLFSFHPSFKAGKAILKHSVLLSTSLSLAMFSCN